MKRSLTLAAWLLAGLMARADLIVEQKIVTPMADGPSVFQIKGNIARIDTVGPGGGNISILIDAQADMMITLIHQQRVAVQASLPMQRKKAEAAMKSAGINVGSAVAVPTGKKEKIGEWDTEEYTVTLPGVVMHIWTAPNFPKGAEYRAAMAKFTKAASGGALDPNQFDVPGFIVKSEAAMGGAIMSTTLVRVKEIALPDSVFQVPEDYTFREMPQGTFQNPHKSATPAPAKAAPPQP